MRFFFFIRLVVLYIDLKAKKKETKTKPHSLTRFSRFQKSRLHMWGIQQVKYSSGDYFSLT